MTTVVCIVNVYYDQDMLMTSSVTIADTASPVPATMSLFCCCCRNYDGLVKLCLLGGAKNSEFESILNC